MKERIPSRVDTLERSADRLASGTKVVAFKITEQFQEETYSYIDEYIWDEIRKLYYFSRISLGGPQGECESLVIQTDDPSCIFEHAQEAARRKRSLQLF